MRRVNQKAIDVQLMALVNVHGYTYECWGWGASSAGHPTPDVSKATRCVDCDKRNADLRFGDGYRCWRCAFWRHASGCPWFSGLVNVVPEG